MSRLKINALRNTAGTTDSLTLNADGSVSSLGGTLSPFTGFKNRIINGDMRIDQRNAGASATTSGANGPYTVDRWRSFASLGAFSTQRSSTAPVDRGFVYSAALTVTAAATPDASTYGSFVQAIEGFNIADLGWGTSNAKPVSLSFEARSSVAGTYVVSIHNSDGSRCFPAQFVIQAANTWQSIVISVPGCTDGTWGSANNIGLSVRFSLNDGSNYNGTADTWNSSAAAYVGVSTASATRFGQNAGATFYITGVQLEKGNVATEFERRDYGRELAMCQRYARPLGDGLCGVATSGTNLTLVNSFDPPMRAAPTTVLTDTSVTISDNYSSDHTSTGSSLASSNQSAFGGRFNINGFSGLTSLRFYNAFGNTNGSFILFSSEL